MVWIEDGDDIHGAAGAIGRGTRPQIAISPQGWSCVTWVTPSGIRMRCPSPSGWSTEKALTDVAPFAGYQVALHSNREPAVLTNGPSCCVQVDGTILSDERAPHTAGWAHIAYDRAGILHLVFSQSDRGLVHRTSLDSGRPWSPCVDGRRGLDPDHGSATGGVQRWRAVAGS